MSERQPQASHAPNEVSVRGIVWGGVAIAVGIMLVAVAAWLLWHWWGAPSGARPYGGPNTRNVPKVTPPGLQSAPLQERAQYQAEKRKLLESWQWLDQQHGIARIPIEEAMRIMANQGQGQGQSQSQSQSGKPADARKESP
ncbi:hypothetical protein SB861_53575 [Paraburkholderia sp. SIMBA_049]